MEEGPTRTAPPGPAPTPARLRPSGRFVAGTVLVNRYRIVTLLGRGGMGEVYKAEDLKLDQPVALKFLPETLALSPQAISRFHSEVRIARLVSHPHVCRVYDIGEIDGLHFLTMEFIDGEDLASLLRRIGRLPPDKAIELARQICAGLAAAHDAGVLHRDLKPANVMIDGRGRVRITDFGVAAIAREIRSESVLAGTPAYLAPEQLKGEDATVRSDIYALGLVLYEMFTGKRAVEARSVVEAVLLHHASRAPITTPSTQVADLDPLVERAILRCLEKEPASRPASAIQVAAALPGGDPLQAALAAGETPSPEMVAAAGSRETMRPVAGVAILGVTLLLLILGAWGRTRTSVLGRVPLDLSSEVLAHQAHEVLVKFGYSELPVDTATGFDYNLPFIRFVRSPAERASRWSRVEKGRPAAVYFWYRESLTPLQVVPVGTGPVTPVRRTNPQLTATGGAIVQLDPQGRLVAFAAFTTKPPPVSGGPAARVNWAPLFAAAELDPAVFQPTPSEWTPGVPFDDRSAWIGVYPAQPDLPLRIEAAANGGKLVAVEMFSTWRPIDETAVAPTAPWPVVILVAAACVVAWRNMRAGRGDRRGARRLAIFFLVLLQIEWLLLTHHVPGFAEVYLYDASLGQALVYSLIVYVLYLALEPYVRRHWPEVLIAWSRALAGRLQDPLVGREALIGVAFGAVWFVGESVAYWTGSSFSARSQLDNVLNLRRVVGSLVTVIAVSTFASLLTCFAVLLLKVVLRHAWLVASAVVASLAWVGGWARGPSGLPQGPPGALSFGLLALLLVVGTIRFGLVAVFILWVTAGLLLVTPTTLNMSAWYAGTSMFTLAAIAAIAMVGCHVAIGRPPILGRRPQSARSAAT